MLRNRPSTGKLGPYRIAALPFDRVAQVYPLVQNALPSIRLGEWIDYATALLRGNGAEAPSGLLAAEHTAGCVAGLCAYRGQKHLGHGKILFIEQLIVLSLFDEARIAAALAAEVEGTAQALGCNAVHSLLPAAGAEPAQQALLALGHLKEARLYCKAIAEPAC